MITLISPDHERLMIYCLKYYQQDLYRKTCEYSLLQAEKDPLHLCDALIVRRQYRNGMNKLLAGLKDDIENKQ
jgi:hypothetical protein